MREKEKNLKKKDMKNIHVLSKNKETRLFTSNSELTLAAYPVTTFKTGKHIYITSDEEIKVNDYITDGYLVWQWKDDSSLLGRKKVILSTDQDLIKDGVQAIDDEFLEWLVKNPSCESVDVESFCKHGDNCPSKGAYHKQHLCDVGYKIIIPK